MYIHHFKSCALLPCSAMSDCLRPHGLYARLLCPWGFSRQEPGVGCHALHQGIFPTLGLNPGLLHCRQILYHLSHQGSPLKSYNYSYSHEVISYYGLPFFVVVQKTFSSTWPFLFHFVYFIKYKSPF